MVSLPIGQSRGPIRRPSAMRRLRLLRPCPEVPPALREAVETHGHGHCEACDEEVVDLTGPDGPALAERRGGRLCGRVAVAAAALAVAATSACSSADLSPAPAAPATTTAPPPTVDAGTLPDDTVYYGFIEYDEPVTPPPTNAPGREKPR